VGRPKSRIEFALTEERDIVRAVLSVDGTRVLNLENIEAPRVTVRHPKTNETELRDLAAYWASRNPATPTPAEVLEEYIASREKDMLKQILDIRKVLRRLAGTMRNADIARKVMSELAKRCPAQPRV
jgi:hypothetical protein